MDLWRCFLKVGDYVHCLDGDGIWFESQIVSIPDITHVKVHFRGWDNKFDIVVNRHSVTIQPVHTKTYKW